MPPMYQPLTGKALRSVELANRRFNLWDGAVRSSKTIASIIAWLRFVRTAPPGDLLMVGKTERTLLRNVVSVIQTMLGTRRAKLVIGSGELWICGRRIWLAGANDSKAEEKIRGMTLVGVYVDELTIIPEGMMKMIGTRLSVPGARFYGTTNPDNPRHWLKRDYLDRCEMWLTPDGDLSSVKPPEGRSAIDGIRFSFILNDNPHLSLSYIKALEAEYSGMWYRRFIRGEWVLAEGSIFDMWDPARHLVEPKDVPDGLSLPAVGVDYGTRHTFAAELVGAGHGRLWTLDEWRWSSQTQRVQLSPVEYSRRLREWVGDRRVQGVYVDPSAADFRRQLWTDGMPGVRLANNDVSPGIRTIASGLSSGKLVVSRRCEGLIEMIPGYCWDERAAATGVDKPVKEADDELDSWRYGVHSSRWSWESYVPLVAA